MGTLMSYGKVKLCQKFGMTLPEIDIYKNVYKNTTKYYSTKLSYALRKRTLNKKFQKTNVVNNSGSMKI